MEDESKNNVSLKQRRLDNIQSLRFVAAGLVLLTHITFYINSRIDAEFVVWHPGAAGASLFFVLSGVVIYLSSKRLVPGGGSGGLFLQRRVQRIVPLYWLFTTAKLALVLMLPAALIKNQANLAYVIESYLLIPVQNTSGKIEPLHGVGWTLIHEMYFYYVFALGLTLRRSPVVFSTVVISGFTILGLFVDPSLPLLKVWCSEQNMLFVTGMLIAYAYEKGISVPFLPAFVIFVIGLVTMLIDPVRAVWTPFFHRFDIGAAIVVIGAIFLRVPFAKKVQDFAVWLGDGSYSVYLLHPLLAPALIYAISRLQVVPLAVLVPLTWIGCLAAGQLLFIYVESPLIAKIRTWTEAGGLRARASQIESIPPNVL